MIQQLQITVNVDLELLRENYETNSGESSQGVAIEQLVENEISLDPSMSIQDVTNLRNTLNVGCDVDDARDRLEYRRTN